jgi:ubiquinone/menaquinone biosynthesis C-methylase UbiE
MNITNKLVQIYFDYVYSRTYDFTTGRLNSYRKLQELCVSKVKIRDNDTILCVGLGTGNELLNILKKNEAVNIVGIDYSRTALCRAKRKALALGKEIRGLVMDARHLDFPARSFDEVICVHVMDYIVKSKRVTKEIFRVLREGGQFVITYPSDREGVRLGLNLLSDIIRDNTNSGKNSVKAFVDLPARLLAGTVYIPLLLRQEKVYSHTELTEMFSELTAGPFQVEEYPVYQDFIVYGKKST